MENAIKVWAEKVNTIFDSLPDSLKSYKNKVLFKSIALDHIMMRDCVVTKQPDAVDIGKAMAMVKSNPGKEEIARLISVLEKYYLARRDAGEFEHSVMQEYLNKPALPILVMTYGRYEKNLTLNLIKWSGPELVKATKVFVQSDQVEKYKKYYPEFDYVVKDVDSVGARTKYALEYCVEHNIDYCLILEDEFVKVSFMKKGGIDFNSKQSKVDEEKGFEPAFLKYWQHKSLEVFKNNPLTCVTALRNRACSHAEQTTIIGYQDPLRGGCPNLGLMVDVKKFKPIYDAIPEKFYSPQYDWAYQCAIVKSGYYWQMVTFITKEEMRFSESVIGFTGERDSLAKEIMEYFGVEDKFKCVHIKSERGSAKLQYIGGFPDVNKVAKQEIKQGRLF